MTRDPKPPGSPPDRGRSIVPPEELRCVWMSAGILSYQLCEREFDCESCPLDDALRMHFPRPKAAAGTHAPPTDEARALLADRRYSRGHCWVKPCGEGRAAAVRVGVEPGLAAALLGPRSVVPPMAGEPMQRGEVHLWIVAGCGTYPLATPVDGTLRTVNPALADRPHLIASRPFDEGWLYEVDPRKGPPGPAPLMDAAAATAAYAADARRLRGELLQALASAGGAEPALADGGTLLNDLSEMLGPETYFALLHRAYG